MRRSSFFLFLVAVAMVPACGGGGGEMSPGAGDDGPDPASGDFVLEFVTGPRMTVGQGAQADLVVRYIDPKGDPAEGTVWFDVEGDARGSTVNAAGAQADDAGEAVVTLRAGTSQSEFDVIAAADYADPIRFHIQVSTAGAGDLRVSLSYEGVRRLRGADIYLYEGRNCENLDPQRPAPADLLDSVQSLRDDATFERLETGSQWAVFAAALNESGHIAAWGCWPEARIEDDGETVVELPLQDLPITSQGRWELESHFDLGAALPENIDQTFDALAEMSDDPNDPATFILDQLRDQIDEDALRFAFDAARVYWDLDEELNRMIDDAAPSFATDALGAAGDLGRALQDTQIDSDLRMGQPDEFDMITAEHELIDLVLHLDGVTTRFSMANDVRVQATTARDVHVSVLDEQTAEIDPHQFRVGMGTLVLFALNEMVLPRFDGSPHSLRELVEGAVDCSDVGSWLSDTVGMGGDNLWEELCGFAVAASSLYAEMQIVSMTDRYDVMTLEGSADIKDPNGDLGFDRLDDGRWDATWSGDGGQVRFPGSFEGDRY